MLPEVLWRLMGYKPTVASKSLHSSAKLIYYFKSCWKFLQIVVRISCWLPCYHYVPWCVIHPLSASSLPLLKFLPGKCSPMLLDFSLILYSLPGGFSSQTWSALSLTPIAEVGHTLETVASFCCCFLLCFLAFEKNRQDCDVWNHL